MKRLQGKVNEPELFNQDRYIGNLACHDMEKIWKMMKYFKSRDHHRFLSVGCLNEAIVPIMSYWDDVEVFGLDFADKVLDFLRPRFPHVKYITHDVRKEIPIEDIDYIIAGELIEHLEDPKKFIDECLRALKPGGWLSISTPWEEGIKQGAVDKEAHIWSFSEQDMKDFGFTEIELLKEGNQTSMIAWQRKLEV